MKKIVSIIVLLVLISGCGGSSNSRSSRGDQNGTTPIAVPPPSNTPTEVIYMVLDEPYQVYKYDEINKTSNKAQISIIHFEDGSTGAVLKVGSATLTRY